MAKATLKIIPEAASLEKGPVKHPPARTVLLSWQERNLGRVRRCALVFQWTQLDRRYQPPTKSACIASSSSLFPVAAGSTRLGEGVASFASLRQPLLLS